MTLGLATIGVGTIARVLGVQRLGVCLVCVVGSQKGVYLVALFMVGFIWANTGTRRAAGTLEICLSFNFPLRKQSASSLSLCRGNDSIFDFLANI